MSYSILVDISKFIRVFTSMYESFFSVFPALKIMLRFLICPNDVWTFISYFDLYLINEANFLKIGKNKIYQKYSIMEQPFIVLTDCVGQEFERSRASEHKDGSSHSKVWVISRMSDCWYWLLAGVLSSSQQDPLHMIHLHGQVWVSSQDDIEVGDRWAPRLSCWSLWS